MNSLIKHRYFWRLAIVVLCAYILWPLFRPGFYVSDDGEWMIIRLSAFYQSLAEHQFPVRFLGRLNHGYGYPVANFLYPGFLYIGSILHYIGFSFIHSIKIILGLSIIVAGVSIFMWLRNWFDEFSSGLGTFSFLFAPYVLFDLYVRGSVGEILALSVFSFLLYSIESRHQSFIAPAVMLLILSHNSLALIFLFFICAYVFVRKKWRVYISLLLGLGMSSFFWYPALYERRYVMFDDISISNPFQYFVTNQKIFLIGISTCVIVFLSFFRRRVNNPLFVFFVSIFLLILVLASPLSRYIWQWKALASMLQFPYRLLALHIVVGAWIVAYFFKQIDRQMRWKVGSVVILTLCIQSLSILWNIIYINKPNEYYSTNEATTTVHDEYMPRWVQDKPTKRAATRYEIYRGDSWIEERNITTQRYEVIVHAKQESIVQFNSVYYPGWGSSIDDKPTPIEYQNTHGVIRVTVPRGVHRVVVEFRETIQRFLSDVVAIITSMIYIILILTKQKRYLG